MDTILQGMSGVLCYLDDTLIVGKNKEEHLATVEEVLKRLQNEGLRVNKEKCLFLRPELYVYVLLNLLYYRLGLRSSVE